MGSVLQALSEADLKSFWKLLTTRVNKECFVKDISVVCLNANTEKQYFRSFSNLGLTVFGYLAGLTEFEQMNLP